MPEVRLSEDERQAAIVLAEGERMGASQALIFLARRGVRYGHLPRALAALPDLVGPAELVVAEAEGELPAHDARIDMLAGNMAFAYEAEPDALDEPAFPPPPLPRVVEPGDVVAIKVRAVPGRAGRTVTGKPLAPATEVARTRARDAADDLVGEAWELATVSGNPRLEIGAVLARPEPRDAELRAGMGCEPAGDGLRMLATLAGNPSLEDGVVVVRPEHRVEGDLTFAVGDVAFDGNVLVMGDVEPGRTIEATGDVTVLGVVVGATITAGKRIVVHGGVRNNAALQAGTDVIAQFVEGSRVRSGRWVFVREELTHGHVEEAWRLACGGGVVGGQVHVFERVEARELGTRLATPTRVEVVPPPPPPDPRLALMKERQVLATTIAQVRIRVEEAQRVVARQGTHRQKGQDAAEMLEKLLELHHGLKLKDKALEARITAATAQEPAALRATVKVREAIHAGVAIQIGPAVLRIEAEYPASSLWEADGSVQVAPLVTKGNIT